MKLIKSGVFRNVILTKKFAIKIPKNLSGVLVNLREWYVYTFISELKYQVAPTHITLFGILNIQKICLESRIGEYDFQTKKYMCKRYNIEHKKESFGVINNRHVLFDYGNSYWLQNCFNNLKLKYWIL